MRLRHLGVRDSSESKDGEGQREIQSAFGQGNATEYGVGLSAAISSPNPAYQPAGEGTHSKDAGRSGCLHQHSQRFGRRQLPQKAPRTHFLADRKCGHGGEAARSGQHPRGPRPSPPFPPPGTPVLTAWAPISPPSGEQTKAPSRAARRGAGSAAEAPGEPLRGRTVPGSPAMLRAPAPARLGTARAAPSAG